MTYMNMPEEQRQKQKLQEQEQNMPQAQGWAISGDPLREPPPAITDVPPLEEHNRAQEATKLEYRTPDGRNVGVFASAPLFGYVGVGIAIAAMLVGIAAMVLGVIWLVGWISA